MTTVFELNESIFEGHKNVTIKLLYTIFYTVWIFER